MGGVVGQLAATGVGRAVLAGFLFQLALGVQRTRRALERQVGAFATGELAGGTDITSHLFSAPQTRRFFGGRHPRSEEHTSELQSLMRSTYAVFCLKKKTNKSK